MGQEQPKVSAEPSRVLIAYYSWGGNTKYAAAQIQRATGGTLFEIKPVKPYPSEYRECTVQARKEIQEGVRPELAAKVEDMGKYDVIFIGSPNWWSTIAPPVASFLASYDLYGKTVRMEFYKHLRGEEKFADLAALRAQVMVDAQTVREYFSASGEKHAEDVPVEH